MKDTAHLKGFGQLATLLIAQKWRPSLAFRFANFVEKLIRTRGPKGAMLYLDALGEIISEECIGYAPKNPKRTWVKRIHVSTFKRTKNRHLLQRATKLKRHIMSSHLTQEQISKFLTSVERPPVDDCAFHLVSVFTQRGMNVINQYTPKTRGSKPKPAILAYVKRELSKGHQPKTAYERALFRIRKDLVDLTRLGYFEDREIAQIIYDSLAPMNRIEVDRLRFLPLKEENYCRVPHIGSIHCTQEPGMKARFFASPQLLVQCCMEPLKSFFMQTLQALPNDACFDHHKVLETIREWLNLGRTVYSLDQQDATNRFPSRAQHIAIARTSLAGSPQARLFRYVSEEAWEISADLENDLGRSSISWTVGQPLGTGPSFGAYSVAHHALVMGLCDHLGLPLNCYFILGDDFVTCEEELAVNYRSLMERIGVPISETKSIISNRCAEFAGFTILKSEAFRPGRWREVTEDSLLSFVTDPGYDYKRVVPKFWVPLIQRLVETPYPFGLYRPNLWDMTELELSAYGKTICLSLLKAILPAKEKSLESDWLNVDDEFDFFSDPLLLREFFRSTRLTDVIYTPNPDEKKNTCLARALQREEDLAKVRLNWSPTRMQNEDLRFVGTHASVCRRQMSSLRLSCSIPEGDQTIRHIGVREYPVQDQESLFNVLEDLPRDVILAIEDLCTLIVSICSSCHALTVDSMGGPGPVLAMWLDSVPAFQKKYATAVEFPGPLDLIRDAIQAFPYYHLDDFGGAPARFTAILRRYARHKEVLPSLRTPLPRKRVV